MPIPLAMVVWIDPGTTSGLCVLGVKPSWLAGEGDPGWEGLGKSISHRWFAQVGRDSRAWIEGKAVHMNGHRVVPEVADRTKMQTRVMADLKTMPGLHGEAMVIDQCVDLLASWPRAAWGYESFQLRMLGADLSPVRMFSAVRHAEMRYGKGRPPYEQTASQAKTTGTDERLLTAGLYRAGMPHAVDAARHAAVFLRRARMDSDLRAEAWPRLFSQ